MVIVPRQAVDNLHFLENRSSIRGKLGQNFREGKKEFEDIIDYYDYYPEKDLMIYYDLEDKVTAFEFFKGPLVFEGNDMFAGSYKDLVTVFNLLDPDLVLEDSGFTSSNLGIGCMHEHEPDGAITSAIVFREGYYP